MVHGTHRDSYQKGISIGAIAAIVVVPAVGGSSRLKVHKPHRMAPIFVTPPILLPYSQVTVVLVPKLD